MSGIQTFLLVMCSSDELDFAFINTKQCGALLVQNVHLLHADVGPKNNHYLLCKLFAK